jgi:Ca2+-binding RTX toxin-like protein
VRPEADAPAYLDVSLQYSYLADGNGYTVYLTEGIDDFADSRDDMFGEPGRLSPPTPLAGSLEDDGDTDIVALTLVEGVNYTVTLQGRGEDPLLDGHLTLRDADGNLLLENDDATEAGESRIEYTPTTGGTYFLEVRSSPAADPTGIGGYTVQATALDDYRDLPGDTLEPLGSIELGTPASGVIEFAGDGDLFPITLQAGHAYNVSLRGAGSGDGSLGNGFVRVLDANGALLRADANSGPGKDAALVFLAPQDGSYFLSAGSEADTTGTYSLRIEFRGLSVVGTPDNDSLDGGTGKDTLSGGEGADALGGLREEDVLLGDGGDDTLNGGGGADYLRGDDGKDLLLGGGGADFLNGWGDRDVLRGGSGNDTLEGGNARDRLEGGAGNDVLFGGTGQDAFIFDTRLSTSNVDRVDYFSSGQDLIRLDRSVFTTLARGPLDPGQLTAGSGAEASVDGDDFLIYDTATGNLYYDADATGTASSPMLFAVLKSYGGVAASLTAADIEVIG